MARRVAGPGSARAADAGVAERTEHVTDAVSNTLRYNYDELGRRVLVSASSTADWEGEVHRPADMVERIDYVYDALDRLTRVHARSHNLATSPPTDNSLFTVADNAFTYDGFGRLTSERAAHGEPLSWSNGVASGGRLTEYHWSTAHAPGWTNDSQPLVSRLSRIAYPWGPIGSGPGGSADPGPRGGITYGYGVEQNTRSTNDILSRVERIGRDDDVADQSPVNTSLAAFDYMGASTRRGLIFGPGALNGGDDAIAQTFDSEVANNTPGLGRLDRFGRAKRLGYTADPGGSAVELWRSEYSYDARGNRTAERLWLGGPNSTPDSTNGSDRSWKYAYDALDRLVNAASGKLDSTLTFTTTNHTPLFDQAWQLDELGNWRPRASGDVNSGYFPLGLTQTHYEANGDPVAATMTAIDHNTGFRNQVESTLSCGFNAQFEPQNLSTRNVRYDPVGRMISDGARMYRYDALGRLVQVRDLGGVLPDAFDEHTGQAVGGAGSLDGLGRLVTHYTYDGLGRVIRVQRPEKPLSPPPQGVAAGTPTQLRITDTYYDGVRPLQEVVQRHVPMREEQTGEEPSVVVHRLPLQADAAPTSQALAQPPPGYNGQLGPGSAWSLEREYVHAFDPQGYVDEVLAQLVYVDASGEPAPTPVTLYTLQDANYNVVALADGYGRLAAQYTYFPYGKVRSAEIMAGDDTGTSDNALPDGPTDGPYWSRVIAAARLNRLGHQGLAAERFDEPWADPIGSDGSLDWGGAANTAILGGHTPDGYEVVYHSRNRVYAPDMGRFISSDPFGTGVPVLSDLVFGGVEITPAFNDPDYLTHYADGMNTHAAYAGCPASFIDPGGLWLGMALELGAMGLDAYMNAMGTMGDAMNGVSMIGSFMEFTDQYGINGVFDVNWALDWSAGDDWYTQSGAPGEDEFDGTGASGGGGIGHGVRGPMMAAGVNPFPGQTPTLPLGDRRHGGDWHNNRLRKEAKQQLRLQSIAEKKTAECGSQNVRFNQTIKLEGGTTIRPDLIVYDPKHCRYKVYEVMDTSVMDNTKMAKRANQIAKALGVDRVDTESIMRKKGPIVRTTVPRGAKRRGGTSDIPFDLPSPKRRP